MLIVAPSLSADLDAPDIACERRAFTDGDLDGAWLVVVCTDDAEVNAAVAAGAAQRRIFCVRADAATGGTARVPAVLRRDGLVVAINGGDDPVRATALRDAISVALDLGELPSRPGRSAVRGGSVTLVESGAG